MVYRRICSCGADYIGEAACNARLRWNKHKNGTDKNSKCAKHLNENDEHLNFHLKERFLTPISLRH